MTIQELREKYYFHDSSIEKVIFDEKDKTLTLTIAFCFWLQPWYKKDEPTNGKTSVIFENISVFAYEHHDFKNFLENLNTEIVDADIDEDGAFEIIVREYTDSQPLGMDFWIMKIKADNVEVTEIERYNL